MNASSLIALAIAISAVSFLLPATAPAETRVFLTEDEAQKACKPDEVVWVDLDRGRYFHKSQAAYGKSNNGVYSCAKAAHSQYRESHD